jgi:hypothetical protein
VVELERTRAIPPMRLIHKQQRALLRWLGAKRQKS